MLAVPPAFLEQLHLKAGAPVGMAIDGSRLIIVSSSRPRYTLTELLATSHYSEPQSPQDREWLVAPTVGKEIP